MVMCFFVDVASRESEENESSWPSLYEWLCVFLVQALEFLEQDDLTQDACENHGAGIFTKATLRNPYG